MSRLNYFRLAIVLVAFVCGVIFANYKNHQRSYLVATVKIPQGVSAKLYLDNGGDGPYNYNQDQPLYTNLHSGDKLKLKNNTYDLVINDSSGKYNNLVKKIDIGPSNSLLSASPTYTNAKLASLLPVERPDIIAALYAKYPDLSKNYSLGQDELFSLGDWYGLALKPNQSIADDLRVIMHKQSDGMWVVAVNKPSMVFGQPANPEIPLQVLEGTNSLKSN